MSMAPSCTSKPAVHCKPEHYCSAGQMDSAWWQAEKTNPAVHRIDQEENFASPAKGTSKSQELWLLEEYQRQANS